MNQILVWKSKHCDYYYDASTPKLLDAAAVDILTRLMEEGWLYEDDEPLAYQDKADVEAYNLTEEQLAAIPESLRGDLVKRANSVKSRLAEAQRINDQYAAIKAITDAQKPTLYKVKRSDGSTGLRSKAWDIVRDRSGGEYEDYDLEDVQQVTL